MGVVNVTPDSFSDGGRFIEPERAVEHARYLSSEGADLVDLGAESTRPGSDPVPAATQLQRLLPVIGPLASHGEPCLSIDTASAEVADRALAAGAHVINDVSGLGDPAMAEVVARHRAGLVIMHMRGTPASMQEDPRYEDATSEIGRWLADRVERAERAGIARERIAIDPGIGFGKTLRHNLEILSRLDELAELGLPLMIGVSRKSFLGKLTEAAVDERLEQGVAAAAIAVFQGAGIVRTHDVGATVKALRVAEALRAARRSRTEVRR